MKKRSKLIRSRSSSNRISLTPSNNLALVYIKQGRAQDAIEPLRKMVQLEPTSVFGQHALGMAYVQIGEKDGAMQQYNILKDLNPRLAADLLRVMPR